MNSSRLRRGSTPADGWSRAVTRGGRCACHPMEDLEENGAVVNALQRHADVVVQKSLAEGFGLTVAEAMWKSRPLVGSRVGGIPDQVTHGETGLLVDDPRDLKAFGCEVSSLLEDRRRAEAMGKQAHERGHDRYLASSHLIDYLTLIGDDVLQSAETPRRRDRSARQSRRRHYV